MRNQAFTQRRTRTYFEPMKPTIRWDNIAEQLNPRLGQQESIGLDLTCPTSWSNFNSNLLRVSGKWTQDAAKTHVTGGGINRLG
jgi:hypothetical protein